MDKKQVLRKRILDELAHQNNNFSVNVHSSLEHEKRKLEEFYRRKKLGHEVMTEVKTKNGKCRFDLLDLSEGNGKIIEVLHSETLEEAKKKVKKYPDFLEIEFIEN